MNTCRQIRRCLDETEYAEDLFTRETEQHLLGCPECRKYQSDMAALRGLLKSEKRVTAPDHFDTVLAARMRGMKRPSSPSWFGLLPTPLMTGLAALVILAVVFSVRTSNTRPADVETASATNVAAPVQSPSISNDPENGLKSASEIAPLQIAETRSVGERIERRASTAGRRATEDGERILLLISGPNSGERMVAVPNVVYGAQPVIHINQSRLETDDDSQRIF